MKNYVFDARALLNPNYRGRGVARYVRSLITASYKPGDIIYFNESQMNSPEVMDFLRLGFKVSSKFETSDEYIFMLCSPFEDKFPFELGYYRREKGQEIHVVLYDLIPYLAQDDYLRGAAVQSRYYACLNMLREADKVLCISESTRSDAIRVLDLDPEKCVNIFTGVDDFFFDQTPAEPPASPMMLSNRPFIFTVSGLHPSKNLKALVTAFADSTTRLDLEYDLRIVLPVDVKEEVLKLLPSRDRRRLMGSVHVLAGLTEAEIKWHYQNCALFAYPSRYEGFGLPPAEALVSGACTISSNRASLAEVVTSKHAQFDPDNIAEMAQLMKNALTDEALRKKIMTENSQTVDRMHWSSVAKTVNALRPTTAKLPAAAQDTVAPIDIFTALPPHRSGVIEYTVNFLNTIAGQYPIRVFYPQGSQPMGLDSRIRSYPISTAPYLMGPPERRFFVLGNSDAYIDVYDFALHNAGNLWLHDARYSGLVFAKCFMRDATDWEGVRQIVNLANREGYQTIDSDPGFFSREGALFIRPLLAREKGKIIIHNSIAERYVQAEAGSLMSEPQICNLPLVSFDKLPASTREDVSITKPLNVISLGFVSDGKMPEDVVEGCGLLSMTRPVNLTFCGQVDEQHGISLQRQADIYPDLNLSFTGFQPMESYRKTIRQSDAAIQLRRHYNGESSATLLDLIAGGVRVITNLVNYDEELFDLLSVVPSELRGPALHRKVAEALKNASRPAQEAVDALFEKRDPVAIMEKMLA